MYPIHQYTMFGHILQNTVFYIVKQYWFLMVKYLSYIQDFDMGEYFSEVIWGSHWRLQLDKESIILNKQLKCIFFHIHREEPHHENVRTGDIHSGIFSQE